MNSLVIVIGLLACIWLSWYITQRFVRFAMEQRLLDIPNARSSHTRVTPRGGGISFVMVLLASVVLLALLHKITLLSAIGLLAGGAIAITGLLDDRRGLSIRSRLIIQLIATAISVYCFLGLPLGGSALYRLIVVMGFGVAVLGLTWLINVFNFMDGIDGLAASEAAYIAILCSLISVVHGGFNVVALLLGIFAGAIVGFLIWNWHPAHIFMGDAGSCFLGYSLGALTLLGAQGQELSPWVPLILLGVFVVDATLTLLRRMLRKETWYRPHRLHAFQHASQVLGHRTVTGAVIAINILWLTPWAVAAQAFPSRGPVLLLAAWTPVIGLAYLFHAGEVLTVGAIPRWRTVACIVTGATTYTRIRLLDSLRSSIQTRMSYYRAILIALLSAGCSYIALLSDVEGTPRNLTPNLIALAAVLSAVQIGTLLLFQLHRCHWHLLLIEEVPNLIGMSLAATLFGVLCALGVTQSNAQILPRSVFVLQALLMVSGLILLQVLAVTISHRDKSDSSRRSAERVVIYGADAAGVGISSDLRRLETGYRLVGFVDSRAAMRGIQIAGGQVLGSDGDIRKLVDTYRVDKVLISAASLRTQKGQSFVRHCRSEAIDCHIIPSVASGRKVRQEAKRPAAAVYL